jgi:hypothetical protein
MEQPIPNAATRKKRDVTSGAQLLDRVQSSVPGIAGLIAHR